MRYCSVLVYLHLAFVISEVTLENFTFNKSVPYLNNLTERNKRLSPDYGWGFIDWNPENTTEFKDMEQIQIRTDPTMEETFFTNELQDPCGAYAPAKPDFSARYRRLSESKCYEHIWEIKNREEKERRAYNCTIVNLRKKNLYATLVGPDLKPAEFPHMAAIGWKGLHQQWLFKCAASLISNKFLITAAHCTSVPSADTKVADPIPKIVRLGVTDLYDTDNPDMVPEDIDIHVIMTHPSFNAPRNYYDVALIELHKEVMFSKLVHPACMWTSYDTTNLGLKGIVTGWGIVKRNSFKSSLQLQKAEVDFIDSEYCEHLLRPWCSNSWCGLEKHQLCAGTLGGGANACQGDFGGPIQVKIPLPPVTEGNIFYIIGITSFGFKCGRANTPGVYTSVSSFLDWIEGIVWPQEYYSKR